MDALETSASANGRTQSAAVVSKPLNTKLYFALYILIIAYNGFLLTFPGAIYIELQNNLNAETNDIAWAYSSMSMSFIVSNILSGYIIDKFDNTHRYIALTIFISLIAVCVLPFITNISVVYILFIIIGYTFGSVNLTWPVFIYRLYPIHGKKMFFVGQTVLAISTTIVPLIIQLSITLTDKYKYAFFVIALLLAIDIILLTIFPTPKHDELRTIKREIHRSMSLRENTINDENDDITNEYHPNEPDIELVAEIARKVSIRLSDDPTHKRLEYIIIACLIIIMASFGALENATINLITTYVTEYVQLNDKIGRYLVSCYWGTMLLTRIVLSLFENVNPQISILIEWSVKIITDIIFIVYGHVLPVLYVVYCTLGMFGSCTFPGVFNWCENVKPVSGKLTCLFLVGLGIGYSVMLPIMGELIVTYGAKVVPIGLIVPLVIGLIATIVGTFVYGKFKRRKNDVFATTEEEERITTN